MPTTRRSKANGSATSVAVDVDVPARKSSLKRTSQQPKMRSAFLPTVNEALLLAVFPLTLILGSLYTTLSIPQSFSKDPTVQASYSVDHQSYQPPSAAPSYFATKRNVFNVYFVKVGWFWMTLGLLVFTLLAARGRRFVNVWATSAQTSSKQSDPTSQRTEQDSRLRRLYQVALRYVAVTTWWVILTQWFFGPSLIDRAFRLSGGVCTRETAKERKAAAEGDVEAEIIAHAVSNAACKMAGGRWTGGFDVSGHVFLLVLGSGMLWLEVLPLILPSVWGLGGHRFVSDNDDVSSEDVQEQAGAGELRLKKLATGAALTVTGLAWWMLLMTSAYFHTWVEKALALAFAAVGLWTVYWLPRVSPTLRAVLGLPGV